MERFFPKALIAGIQVGLGIKLAMGGTKFVMEEMALGIPVGIAMIFLTEVATLKALPIPVALLAFMFGMVVCLLRYRAVNTDAPQGMLHVGFSVLDPRLLWEGFLDRGALLGLTQLPLTLLNSVISVCALSETLYGRKKRASAVSVAVSVGLMNVVGAFFGTMPCCHGAGGLAAQHKFGARSGVAVLFLGTVKLYVFFLTPS